MDGDLLVVGAPQEHLSGWGQGGVYVYHLTEAGAWDARQRLAADRGTGFGTSLALDGGTLAVGMPNRDEVTLYTRDGRDAFRARLTLPDPDPTRWDDFGRSLALDGDVLAVGAPLDRTEGGPVTGAVYIHEQETRDHWPLRQRVAALDQVDRGHFGEAVALQFRTLAVGQPQATVEEHRGAGRIVIYEHHQGRFRLDTSLHAGEGARPWSFLGANIALSQGLLAAGTPLDHKVHLFDMNLQGQWSFKATLDEPQASFGRAVDLHAATLVVGAPGARSADGERTGQAILFAHQPPG